MPEIALIFTHLMKPICYSGSVYVLGDTLLTFCNPFSGRFTIATGRNGSLSLIGYLDTDVFKTSFNCSHVGIKKVILKYLLSLSSIVSYKSTNTLAHLCQ